MLDEVVLIKNWGDYLGMRFIKVSERDGCRHYLLNIKAKTGIISGEQNIALNENQVDEYSSHLRSIVQGYEDECTIQDADSPAKLTIRTRYSGNVEILGSIPRDKVPDGLRQDSSMHFKFNIKPESLLEVLKLFTYCKTQKCGD